MITPLPDWTGTVKKVFLLYMFPFAPSLSDIQTAFGGIFTGFSNRPREYFIVVYDASNLQDTVLPAGGDYENEVTLNFVESQSKTVFLFYRQKLAQLGSQITMQPSSFLRNSYFGQDPSKFALKDGNPAIIFPLFPDGANPTYVQAAQTVASAAVLPSRFIRLYFEGGNILQGDTFILAGKNILMGTDLEKNPVPDLDATLEMSNLYGGAEVLFLGAGTLLNPSPGFWQLGYQPSFHIDNLVTLLGPMKDPDSGNSQMVVMLADFISSETLTGPSLILFHQMVDAMTQIESQLTAGPLGGLPVKILKIPSLLVPVTNAAYVLSWNNCIVETEGDSKIVYLPVYASTNPAIQAIITSVTSRIEADFQTLGIQIIWVNNNLLYFSQNFHGSLHCMFCAIERS